MADVGLEHKFEKLIKEMVAGMPDVESAEQLKQGLRRLNEGLRAPHEAVHIPRNFWSNVHN